MKSPKLLKIYSLMIIQGTLVCAELFASQLTHSLILLADAYHTVYLIMNLILHVISFKMTNERTLKNTFGWARIEVLGMLVNMIFVAALSFSVSVEGIQQIVHASHEISHPTNFVILIVFGICSLIMNFLNIALVHFTISKYHKEKCLFYSSSNDISVPQRKANYKRISSEESESETKQNLIEENVNIEIIGKTDRNELSTDSRPQNPIRDLLLKELSYSVLLIICGIIVIIAPESPITKLCDPISGIISAILLCTTNYKTMKSTGLILLQTVPQNFDVENLKRKLLKEFPSIINIHELHIWCLTNSQIVATLHIILSPNCYDVYDEFSVSLNAFFVSEGISLATVQPEFDTSEGQCATECLMQCSKITNNNCNSLMCCDNDVDNGADNDDAKQNETNICEL